MINTDLPAGNATIETTIDAIVIGRNEGARLISCFDSLEGRVRRIVYVDSGSTDGSVAAAEARGVTMVALDMTQPFTAARARNAGFAVLAHDPPDFIQFLDGDCDVHPGWIAAARTFLQERDDVAVVCGRRREKFPQASIYNRLCDREWDTPIGQTSSCGGDALMRATVFAEVGGFNPTLIAGEEPELCVRIRALGWKIWRLDHEMTAHDAAITRFAQWWKRMRRGGHAFAEGAALHGAPPERHFVAPLRRIVLWGIALPLVALFCAVFITPFALLLLAAYPLQILRLGLRGGLRNAASWEDAVFMTIGKFPEAMGVIEFHWRRLIGRPAGLIEYK